MESAGKSTIQFLSEGRLTKAANIGSQIRCISLLGGTEDATLTSGSFFISFDDGTSYCHGALPPRLADRIEREAQKADCNELPSLRYLATGPGGSYYTELTNGECWWGTCYNDEKFHNVLSEIDVHRIAFGPCFCEGEDEKKEEIEGSSTSDDVVLKEDWLGRGQEVVYSPRIRRPKKKMHSWIILGRDGRIVWQNIPARLNYLLSNRGSDMGALYEVSLGRGGSYFVKFMDGTIDYCLPEMEDDISEFLENGGTSDNTSGRRKKRAGDANTITSIMLHVDSSDYIIRHIGTDT
eukprot:12272310-Ditylum_brightwellii.AAC.1